MINVELSGIKKKSEQQSEFHITFLKSRINERFKNYIKKE